MKPLFTKVINTKPVYFPKETLQNSFLCALPDKDLECPICKDSPMLQPTITPCGHSFCKHCIDNYFNRNRSCVCPVCRKMVKYKHVSPNFTLLNIVQHMPAYKKREYEMSIDSVKERVVKKWGVLNKYETNYTEDIQRRILEHLLQLPDGKEEDIDDILISTSWTFIERYPKENNHRVYWSFPPDGYFLKITAERIGLLIHTANCSNPIKS